MNSSISKTKTTQQARTANRSKKSNSKADASSGNNAGLASQAFSSFAKWTAAKSGSATTFVLAILVIVVWAVTGPIFQFNDTWQLVINTATTIVTFLMVFLIQNSQNRDTAAIQVKLDELIRVQEGARNVLLDLEELDQKDLECIRRRYHELAEAERLNGNHCDLDDNVPVADVKAASN